MNTLLKKTDCLLMVVDIQERLHAAMDAGCKDTYIRNTAILIETAKAFNVPVIVSEQYSKGLGQTIADISKHLADIHRHDKLYFSCYRDENIKKAIHSTGRKTVIIIGIETHVCVMQTALDLMAAGYKVIVANDAACSRKLQDHTTALNALDKHGALIYPTETIAFMLIEKAGTEIFKQLAPLFK